MEWTDGFDIPDVIGKDVVTLFNEAFARMQINARVHGVCTEVVGTLMSCAYDHENVRVGVILDTEINAAYFDPIVDDIINTEWSKFQTKLLPRQETTDIAMDRYSRHPGKRHIEKMVSGHYIGELVRLLAIEVFAEQIVDHCDDNMPMNRRWGLSTQTVGDVLGMWYNGDIEGIQGIFKSDRCRLDHFSKNDVAIFAKLNEKQYTELAGRSQVNVRKIRPRKPAKYNRVTQEMEAPLPDKLRKA